MKEVGLGGVKVSVGLISENQAEHLVAANGCLRSCKCHLCSQTQGLTQVTLVGHDWGGMFAWNMALYYPERLRYVVLYCLVHTLYTMTSPSVVPV